MAGSAHAYVWGNTQKFYEWLRKNSSRAIPEGPSIWICGDCHVGNIGPLADSDGKIEIQIRDLDQTVLGNSAHDLVRLALIGDRCTRVRSTWRNGRENDGADDRWLRTGAQNSPKLSQR
jgi:uncharacterized protein (DUF2252 family)